MAAAVVPTAAPSRRSRRPAPPALVAPVVRLEGVSKAFRRGRERVEALRSVDLDVAPGEVLALVGPSGSGKSTLLHLAGALDVPDAGQVVLGGCDVATMSSDHRAQLRRRQVGFVFQLFHLLPALSALENVALPLLLDGVRHAERRAAELLDRVGLSHRAGHSPAELSGGEMQRVAVARALVGEPEVVLADEPTGNLDSATGAVLLDLLVDQARDLGAALLLVTHDATAAKRAGRRVTLRDGRIS